GPVVGPVVAPLPRLEDAVPAGGGLGRPGEAREEGENDDPTHPCHVPALECALSWADATWKFARTAPACPSSPPGDRPPSASPGAAGGGRGCSSRSTSSSPSTSPTSC